LDLLDAEKQLTTKQRRLQSSGSRHREMGC
jgi:hypothetical protein